MLAMGDRNWRNMFTVLLEVMMLIVTENITHIAFVKMGGDGENVVNPSKHEVFVPKVNNCSRKT